MNLSDLGKLVAQYGAPILGGVLGGPAGASVGQVVANVFGGDINNDRYSHTIYYRKNDKCKIL